MAFFIKLTLFVGSWLLAFYYAILPIGGDVYAQCYYAVTENAQFDGFGVGIALLKMVGILLLIFCSRNLIVKIINAFNF